MVTMNRPASPSPRARATKRFLLIPEAEQERPVEVDDAAPPRIRRYRLASLGGRRPLNLGPAELRPAGDFSHLAKSFD
jgi:hypothetical protein